MEAATKLGSLCHQRGLGQEVFSIEMTNQFPDFKIKRGISGQIQSLSLTSTSGISVKFKASRFAVSFFPGITSPDIFYYTD